jgi:hypothetical protein
MKKYLIFLFTICGLLFYSCEGMYDNMKEYYGEIVYPAKYDTIAGHIGYERVEIDLMKAGRIPQEQIKMGKAKKTVIEYDDEKIVLDHLVSWVNVTGLTQSKIYRINVYTLDEYDNQSVPQEIALIPFTSVDLGMMAVVAPRIMTSPTSAIIDWPNGFGSVLLDYYGLAYEYTDKDGNVVTGERGSDSRFFVGNLQTGESYTINMKYKIVPKMNSVSILDTLVMERALVVNIPTGATPFSPVERDILVKNGITTFTFDAVSNVTKLVYPIHANSLQDLFYFSNLQELDLTGGSLFEIPTLRYDRNVTKNTVGGGPWLPFLRKVSDITSGDTQALKDLLEAGTLEKVRYIPNSMGLDALLAPYVASGVVELVNLPDEVFIPFEYFLDGLVQDGNWQIDWAYPATDAPAGSDLQNVFKAKVVGQSASFVFALPREYKYNVAEYKYLKMKVYAPAKSEFPGNYSAYQRFWFRFMNNMWSFGGHSDFGQEYWEYGKDDFRIADSDLQKWIDIKIDLSQALNRHTRVIVVNIGGEPWLGDITTNITYYFANCRFAKE